MAIAKDFGFIGRLCLDFAQTGDMGYGSQFERLTVLLSFNAGCRSVLFTFRKCG